jgi:hypothetical protein
MISLLNYIGAPYAGWIITGGILGVTYGLVHVGYAKLCPSSLVFNTLGRTGACDCPNGDEPKSVGDEKNIIGIMQVSRDASNWITYHNYKTIDEARKDNQYISDKKKYVVTFSSIYWNSTIKGCHWFKNYEKTVNDAEQMLK